MPVGSSRLQFWVCLGPHDWPSSFGMHWGTFILTDESVNEPRLMLAKALRERGLLPDFFIAPTPGAIINLDP